MKELIRKIARESGLSISQAYSAEFNKFAELIVQECIQAVYDDGQDAEYYQDRIKKRFGVES